MKTTTKQAAENCRYIISEYRKDTKRTLYVCAMPGYCRKADGTFGRDGSFKGGPEWTTKREHALEFKSLHAALCVRAKNPSAKVHPVL